MGINLIEFWYSAPYPNKIIKGLNMRNKIDADNENINVLAYSLKAFLSVLCWNLWFTILFYLKPLVTFFIPT